MLGEERTGAWLFRWIRWKKQAAAVCNFRAVGGGWQKEGKSVVLRRFGNADGPPVRIVRSAISISVSAIANKVSSREIELREF